MEKEKIVESNCLTCGKPHFVGSTYDHYGKYKEKQSAEELFLNKIIEKLAVPFRAKSWSEFYFDNSNNNKLDIKKELLEQIVLLSAKMAREEEFEKMLKKYAQLEEVTKRIAFEEGYEKGKQELKSEVKK